MSLKAIFGSVLAKLQYKTWGSKDTEELADELYSMLSGDGPIVINGPIVIHNPTSGPAISVVNTASAENATGIEISDSIGRRVQLGIGLGSRGIYASNFVYDDAFRSDSESVRKAYGKRGEGGQVEFSPNSNPNTRFTHPGPGVVSSNRDRQEVASGYSSNEAGSGIPDILGNVESQEWEPLPGVGEMLGGIDLSSWTEGSSIGSHPPTTALVSELNGQSVWFPIDLHGWMINRCSVTSVNPDTLTCQREIIGDTITVAKPPSLQRTPFDGKTINGVYYSYIDNQTRTATNATAQETQTISPSYDGSTGYSPGNVVYARWASNGTDVDDVGYIDVNVDARAWVASSAAAESGNGSADPNDPVQEADPPPDLPPAP